MNTITKFIKKEPVLTVAGAAAILSAFWVRPSKEYLSYIDTHVLILLFCLMLVVAGLMKTHLFDIISEKILKLSDSSRTISVVLVNITFFIAMFITNDVALITLVPFTTGLFCEKHSKLMIPLIVLETVAANLGSMMMPFGNPQNLYLFSHFNMSFGHFVVTLLPFGLISLILINASVFLIIKKEKMDTDKKTGAVLTDKRVFFIYIALFAVCILTVLRVLNVYVCFAAVLMVCLLTDRKLLRSVDYNLLFTFAAFFIFVGNLGNIDIIKDTISEFISSREFISGVLASQIISNVPAAIMLSDFAENADHLLIGVNAGGLGTLIASLASLISYKFYARSEKADIKKYLLVFTLINIIFLAVQIILFVCIHHSL